MCNDSRLKPIRACALMWGISRTGMYVNIILKLKWTMANLLEGIMKVSGKNKRKVK